MEKLITKSIVMIFISVFFHGCKINQKIGDSTKEVTGVGEILLPSERKFTLSELSMGQKNCNNLKNKRDFFEKLTNEKEQFRLRSELRNCDNTPYRYLEFIASISNANSTNPEYIAFNENYFKDIVTDQSGIMKPLCEAINQTNGQANTVANSILLGNFKYLFNILILDGYDTFQITKSKKNNDGTFEPISSESISFISNKSQADVRFLGVEKNRIRYTICEGKKYHTVRQVWLEAITDFERQDQLELNYQN